VDDGEKAKPPVRRIALPPMDSIFYRGLIASLGHGAIRELVVQTIMMRRFACFFLVFMRIHRKENNAFTIEASIIPSPLLDLLQADFQVSA
jgi:hypothetical protein